MIKWLYKLLRIPPKPVVLVERPPAPCGNDKEHYFWTEVEGWPCPCCAGIRRREREREDEDRLAAKIAANVVRMQRRRTH